MFKVIYYRISEDIEINEISSTLNLNQSNHDAQINEVEGVEFWEV